MSSSRRTLFGFLFLLLGVWQSAVGCQCSEPTCQTTADCAKGFECTLGRCLTKNVDEAIDAPKRETIAENKRETAAPDEKRRVEQLIGPEDAGNVELRDEPVRDLRGPREEPVRFEEVHGENKGEPTGERVPEPLKEGVGSKCQYASDCGLYQYCLNGSCKALDSCSGDSDCVTKPLTKCKQGICVTDQPTCQVTGQCIPGTVCKQGFCVPGEIPASCTHSSECYGGYLCYKGTCTWRGVNPPTVCQSQSQCQPWETCLLGRCLRKCTSVNQCTSTSVPSCQAGICLEPNLPPGSCRSDSDCLPRQFCNASQQCVTCKAPPECTKDSDCGSGESCVNGQCGQTCTSDITCRGGSLICSQGFCRGQGYHPVGCPEDQEICDLVVSGVQCPNGKLQVTVQNVGQGPAVGRFYLCLESKGSKKGCNALIIMNFGAGGGSLPARGTLTIAPGWKTNPGDLIIVDRPNIILESDENNNTFNVTQSCP